MPLTLNKMCMIKIHTLPWSFLIEVKGAKPFDYKQLFRLHFFSFLCLSNVKIHGKFVVLYRDPFYSTQWGVQCIFVHILSLFVALCAPFYVNPCVLWLYLPPHNYPSFSCPCLWMLSISSSMFYGWNTSCCKPRNVLSVLSPELVNKRFEVVITNPNPKSSACLYHPEYSSAGSP